VAAEKPNCTWYTGYNGDAAADAKNNIKNSTARIQNAAVFGSVLRPAKRAGGAKAHWDCVSEFIHQDWSEDLKKISVPVLAMNGDADQVVPHDTSGPRAVKLVKNGS
jgi:pimeloyl-ACP methyl ester carboxylesterase